MENRWKPPILSAAMLVVVAGYVSILGTANTDPSNVTLAEDCPCTDYAWERRPDLDGVCTGDAAVWGTQAAPSHPVDATPSPGDIAVFQLGHHGTLYTAGHVAYVEQVNQDGSFTISEQGYTDTNWPYPCRTNYRTILSVEQTDEFIHHKDPYPVLIDEISMYPDPAVGGQKAYFTFTIKNSGGAALDMNEIFVAVTTADGELWKAGAPTQTIGQGSSGSFTAVGDTWAEHAGTWQVDRIEIQDTSGTWYSVNLNGRSMPSFDVVVTVPGDLNGDYVVDIYDLVIVGNHFGEDPDDPRVDSRADANRDGEVDIFDLVLVGGHFGDVFEPSVLAPSSPQASAQVATVGVLPETQPITVGNEVKAAIEVAEVSDLYGFQLDLTYDPLILEYVSWESGAFLGADYWVSPDTSTPGTIENAAAVRTTPGVTVSGTGTLVTVTFRAISAGGSRIGLENVKLADNEGNEIPFTTHDGTIGYFVYLPTLAKSYMH
jgi:surface antigen